MNVTYRSLLNGEYAKAAKRPVVHEEPAWLVLRRKRAMWVARAISAGRRRELRRRLKEEHEHGTR
jgi:hypothetical protein